MRCIGGERRGSTSLCMSAKKGYQGTPIACPGCGQEAKSVSYRPCEVTTLMGDALSERAYYHCWHCQHGHCPTDAEFGLEDKHTPGAEEVISLIGATAAFDEGAHVERARLTGLTVSASSVQRITESVGAEVAQRRAEGESFGPAEPWEWPPDANGKATAYVGLDAISVRQQGLPAEPNEGDAAGGLGVSRQCEDDQALAARGEIRVRPRRITRPRTTAAT